MLINNNVEKLLKHGAICTRGGVFVCEIAPGFFADIYILLKAIYIIAPTGGRHGRLLSSSYIQHVINQPYISKTTAQIGTRLSVYCSTVRDQR